MRHLSSHAASDLMILDRDDSAAGLHRCADGFKVHFVDEWIIYDGGIDASRRKLLARFQRFVQKHPAADEHDVTSLLQDLRFSPFIARVLDPGERIIFASNK